MGPWREPATGLEEDRSVEDHSMDSNGWVQVNIRSEKLDWKVTAKIGSLEKAGHRPGGGQVGEARE